MSYEIERTPAVIWSEGSRLAAEMFKPAGAPGARPGILLCHGWGGLKGHLAESYAKPFTAAGFACLVFDYRGWGDSDGKLIPSADTPMLTESGERMVKARVIREVVDPGDQIADILAALAWLMTESGVDAGRVGIWGSSFGAGNVVSAAGMDARIKAVVAQIGSYSPPSDVNFVALARQRMADKARARIEPVLPQGIDLQPNLIGSPDAARMLFNRPLGAAAHIRVPTLFIDAENEEYGEPQMQGGAAFDVVRRNALAERHTFPCTHYEVYDRFYEPSLKLALDWFAKHL